ncbi:MAG TPA: hypothetical protein VGG21_04540 [Acidimicrobiales bacterium]|jgi:hypothetical protein
MSDYRDATITCDPGGIVIKGYYFPWGAKRVKWGDVTGLERVSMGTFTGRWRIWGTANPHLWANLDPHRAKKSTAFILGNGRKVRPFLTPEDPDAFEAQVRERAHLPAGGGESPAPFI